MEREERKRSKTQISAASDDTKQSEGRGIVREGKTFGSS